MITYFGIAAGGTLALSFFTVHLMGKDLESQDQIAPLSSLVRPTLIFHFLYFALFTLLWLSHLSWLQPLAAFLIFVFTYAFLGLSAVSIYLASIRTKQPEQLLFLGTINSINILLTVSYYLFAK